jgi:hypothetical protein
MNLRTVAQHYQRQANRIIDRNTKDGVFDSTCQSNVDFYRDAAANVMKLVRTEVAPVETEAPAPTETEWFLEDEQVAQKFVAKKK